MRYSVSTGESVSVAVVTAVADAENAAPRALPPLSAILDPDALDALFAPGEDPSAGGEARFTFEYSMSRVTVDESDHITVEPARDNPLRPDT